MSEDAASIVNGDEKYEYGFHDDVKPVYSTGRGLTEEVVRQISADRKSTRLNSSHSGQSRMPSSA